MINSMLAFGRLQWLIMFRTLKKLGLFSVILSLFLFTCAYILTLVPYVWTIGLYMLVVVAYHFNRHDITLLSVLYGKRYKQLLFAQYMFIALPFIGISISQGCFFQFLFFPMVSLVAFLPNKVSCHYLSHPFLTKGNYEFIGGFRKVWLAYLLQIILALIGVFVNNTNLAFVCFAFNILVIIGYHNVAFRREYFLNYSSTRQFFKFKLLAILRDYGLLQVPFLVIYSISSKDLVLSLLVYILGCLLVMQALLLRVLVSPNILMQICGESVLVLIAIITGLYPVLMFFEVIVSMALYSMSYMKIKSIVRR